MENSTDEAIRGRCGSVWLPPFFFTTVGKFTARARKEKKTGKLSGVTCQTVFNDTDEARPHGCVSFSIAYPHHCLSIFDFGKKKKTQSTSSMDCEREGKTNAVLTSEHKDADEDEMRIALETKGYRFIGYPIKPYKTSFKRPRFTHSQSLSLPSNS